MEMFELIIVLLVGAAAMTTLSRRIGAPYPVLLAAAGAGLALLPIDKLSAQLDPDLALTLFVAPVLVDAAYDTSPRDLRANWVPVFSLVLFCVGVTVAAVACVAHWLVPAMPWAVAIALGAIVAPPDATAATSILRLISPPHRVLVILEGESLLNDASALLIYRFAVGAAMGNAMQPMQAIPSAALALVGGVALGAAWGWLQPRLTRVIEDNPVHIVTQFVSTFAVWIVAERLNTSPIIAVVVYAVVIAQYSSLDAENRRMSFAVWDVATYVLTALAFVLIGLQLHGLLSRGATSDTASYAGFALAVLGTVIVARLGWVALYNRGWAAHRRFARWRGREAAEGPTWPLTALIGWCGMRGVVTLATALALPYHTADGAAFPFRDLLIVAAFTVVLGTLLIQGLTIGPLIRWLKLSDDGEVEREENLARRAVTRSALRLLRGRREPAAAPLRDEYEARMKEQQDHSKNTDALRLRVIATERQTLERLRRNRAIGDDAFRAVEEEIDMAEAHAHGRSRGTATAPPEGDAS